MIKIVNQNYFIQYLNTFKKSKYFILLFCIKSKKILLISKFSLKHLLRQNNLINDVNYCLNTFLILNRINIMSADTIIFWKVVVLSF